MKVLVIGSGGREHAMVWKLAQSPQVTEVLCAPGNPGTAELGRNIPVPVDDLVGLVDLAEREGVALTVIGPEYPLSLGLVDRFEACGLRVFGPTQIAAQLESSKSFAKEVMTAAKVPTARYEAFDNREEARQYLLRQSGPIVLKADGLAAGKGVCVCHTISEAEIALDWLFDEFAPARVIIEEFLEGVEASYIAAVNDAVIVPFASSHDYKAIFDGNQGPNTGGMGTVSPTPHLSPAQEQQVLQTVIEPVVAELRRREMPFRGFLYAGLMIAPDGRITVLEFNARMGDPEGQVILRRMQSDLFELLMILTDPDGAQIPQQSWSDMSAVCVVMASAGYPQQPRYGDEIIGLTDLAEDNCWEAFQAGTKLNEEGVLVTAGGRVLNITAIGPDLSTARTKAYEGVSRVRFAGQQYRLDIGQ